MLSWFYSGGFSGTSFVWENCLNRTGTSPALNRQGVNIRVAALYNGTFILHSDNVPTNVALVARPCAPDAQSADKSSSSRSRLAKSYGRFAPLSLKQDCFFRMPFSKLTISLPGPPTADNVMIFLHWSFIFQTPLRQLSKVCACYADAWVWKAVFAPVVGRGCRRCRGDVMIFKTCGESARSGLKVSFSDFK